MKPYKKTALIIGLGQIGGSLGMALKKANFFHRIFGYDPAHSKLKPAEKFLTKCFSDLTPAVEQSDLIILSSPINIILEMLQWGFENYPEKFYIDVGSTKSPMMKLAQKFPEVKYIGGHPLAGTEKMGVSSWDENLFNKKPFFITPAETVENDDVQFVTNMAQAVGAVPRIISAIEHDELIALTSHLPLLLSLALMSSFSDRADQLATFVGSGFKSMVRLTGGAPQMGRDLLMSNRENILPELKLFSGKLAGLAKLLEDNREQSLLKEMKHLRELYWQIIEDQS